uniref:Anaphase-promoting complex subunit 13 n=1 Tax=Plectus sambesii TaxID=2011161 RepID=A0A914VH92_9BILA
MSNPSLLARPGRMVVIADNLWKSDVLPHDDVDVPRDQLPDPDTDSLPTTGRPQEALVDIERRWPDLGLGRIRLDSKPLTK